MSAVDAAVMEGTGSLQAGCAAGAGAGAGPPVVMRADDSSCSCDSRVVAAAAARLASKVRLASKALALVPEACALLSEAPPRPLKVALRGAGCRRRLGEQLV